MDGACKIYQKRPVVCKLYPFYFDPFAGVVLDKNCLCLDNTDIPKAYFKLFKRRLKFFEDLHNRGKK